MPEIVHNPLIKALIDGNICFSELMTAYGIVIKYADLSSNLYGFVYADPSDTYLLVINNNLNFETQQKVFLHEINHIIFDMPKKSYFIGLDMQHSDFELNADKLAEEIIKDCI
ncbi:ImmA/IrrE family metallo-endopeptidase [Thermoanaerobacterium sp. PSU-2]|uniref:ImmA/IrrE family metallo-endopeptidase n=1 Tax=Thermoanaerobacterium sp. PSU-2 TaxID=1930849 RepID=UPI000A150BBB|nr:ImmA/IrrE family metallo-endopeptidase [Thermoanaerobacterium sp. PSU-2]